MEKNVLFAAQTGQDAIARLFADAAESARMGKSARRIAEEKFEIEKVAERVKSTIGFGRIGNSPPKRFSGGRRSSTRSLSGGPVKAAEEVEVVISADVARGGPSRWKPSGSTPVLGH